LVAEISWAKNLLIMARCKDDLEREFYLRATRSGELYFRWVDDKGYIGELRHNLVVEPANQSQAPKS
jgi:hypothetical protein